MKIISRKEAKALGLKRYFTGKPCCRGHVAERYTTGNCLDCMKEDSVGRRCPRTDKMREKDRARYSKNPDKKRAASKKYWEKNRELCLERRRQRGDNPARALARLRRNTAAYRILRAAARADRNLANILEELNDAIG